MADVKKETGRKILFSAQKNEGPFILEWVAFHKVIGFTDIVVFSNDCDDGSDVLLDALAEAGEIQHFRHDVPDDVAPQKNAANLALKQNLFRNGDWVMWLDLDEYLFVNSDDHSLDSLIQRLGDANAISIAWRFFGDSGITTWPGRQISPEFCMAERRRRNKRPQVKTLFLYNAYIAGLDIHRPRLVENATPENYPWISSSGKPVDPRFYDSGRGNLFNRITDDSRFYRFGQILHFCVRTPDMFAKKDRRGDGYFPVESNPVIRDQKFYKGKNFNQVAELSAMPLEAPIVRYMQGLLDNEDIRSACYNIDGFGMGLSD